GGDEFVLILNDQHNEEIVFRAMQRIMARINEPMLVEGKELYVTCSAGISLHPQDGPDVDTLLKNADVAMYRAKGAGGRRLEIFDERLRQEVNTHLAIENRLQHALPRHELLLAYQPILALGGGQALACEALVRWRPRDSDTSEDGEMLPATFLPRAEESELIVQIGNWVLHTACTQAELWRRSGIAIPISVNVSARELTELDLAERVREELAYRRLPGRALCLEVSEDAVLRDPERARSALKDVKRLGVAIALDNFGSGQSLGLPSDLPLDILKVDRALIQSFDRDKDRRAVFAATVALAKEAGLTAVAVGIETNRQLALVRELDCSVGQGFLLHNPTAPERLRLRDVAGSVTSAPWRPLVRLRGNDRRN
ncbi:MAG TPA: bifunctional diguanylate cyclase/phosphodiesterase, partial [Patescibacteria group bacterium]|nr:bifunctional diguanylate cyclase/phosphodiesterase [Patescibacteria group bacterium]